MIQSMATALDMTLIRRQWLCVNYTYCDIKKRNLCCNIFSSSLRDVWKIQAFFTQNTESRHNVKCNNWKISMQNKRNGYSVNVFQTSFIKLEEE